MRVKIAYESENILKINLKIAEARNDACLTAFIQFTAKNDCENNKDDQDSSYLSKDFDRSRFNSSAEALGFSPIKPVGKQDAVSYAQNKAKCMKARLNEKLANVMEISNEELNESSLNDCTNCKD